MIIYTMKKSLLSQVSITVFSLLIKSRVTASLYKAYAIKFRQIYEKKNLTSLFDYLIYFKSYSVYTNVFLFIKER